MTDTDLDGQKFQPFSQAFHCTLGAVTTEELLDLLRRCGAQQEGHFLLASGLHSGRYLQCARLLEDPRVAEALGRELAARLAEIFPRPRSCSAPRSAV